MTTEQANEFEGKVEALAKEYGIINAAFCGTAGERFIGFSCNAASTYTATFEVAMNTGRLWQHMRGVVRTMLNDIEKS